MDFFSDESLDSDYVECLDFFSPLNPHVFYNGDVIKLLKYYEEYNLGLVETLLIKLMPMHPKIQLSVYAGRYPNFAKILYVKPLASTAVLRHHYGDTLFDGLVPHDLTQVIKEIHIDGLTCPYV